MPKDISGSIKRLINNFVLRESESEVPPSSFSWIYQIKLFLMSPALIGIIRKRYEFLVTTSSLLRSDIGRLIRLP